MATGDSSSESSDYSDLELMEDLSDVEELEHIIRRPKVYKKRVDVFNLYDDEEFKRKYRFKKGTARFIIDLVSPILKGDKRGGKIPADLMVMSSIRTWCRHEIQDDAADIHGFSQSSMSRISMKVARALASQAAAFIKMPETPLEREKVMLGFSEIKGFPRVIGAIDCSHIRIKRTGGDQAEFYVNRKGFYSLNIQAVCDANLKIRDIVACWRGSTHDSRIYNESTLKRRFESREFGGGHLLGDSGYACSEFLLTPVLRPVTRQEEAYNEAHKSTRNTVERCFGVWKQRFRCLLRGTFDDIEHVKTKIVALAVLHNIAIQMNDDLEEIHEEFMNNQRPTPSGTPAHTVRGNIYRASFINQYF